MQSCLGQRKMPNVDRIERTAKNAQTGRLAIGTQVVETLRDHHLGAHLSIAANDVFVRRQTLKGKRSADVKFLG